MIYYTLCIYIHCDAKNIAFRFRDTEDHLCNQVTLVAFNVTTTIMLMCEYRYALENPALISQQHFTRYGLKNDWKSRI